MILIPIFAVIFALIIDLVIGDPKNKFHPTAWIGMLIGKLVSIDKNNSKKNDKLSGIILTISIVILVAVIFYFISAGLYSLESKNVSLELNDLLLSLLIIIVIGILLKTTIAIKGMQQHAQMIMDALSKNNLDDARVKLSMIVKRETKNLDRQHIISATLESISENTVDGITGPLFYFAIFGLPGAFVYRTINTIDSMIGYKTEKFRNLGWFGANCDKILNYLPARITSLVMVLAVMILGKNWKHSLEIMLRDSSKTESPNAGFPMATLAGALGTRFEKVDHYVLGDGEIEFTMNHFKSTIAIMKLTSILFCIIITIPMIMILSYLGLWLHA
jgi:adenosylcobinamide-phosphate synthase